MVGGRRVRVVDVHNHWDMPLPADLVKGTPFEQYAEGGPDWTSASRSWTGGGSTSPQ